MADPWDGAWRPNPQEAADEVPMTYSTIRVGRTGTSDFGQPNIRMERL